VSNTTFFDNLRQDLKFGIRSMRKNPAFSTAVVLTIALGIGANTAMFSVIRGVLLKPLEYREPDRLVLVTEGATPVRFEEMASASRSYTAVGIFAGGFEDLALSSTGQPEVIKGTRVSANFLHILGVSPLLGRGFLADEDKPGAASVAMISAELWQRRFGRDPAILGKMIILAGVPHTIVGVLTSGFQFPLAGADVWLPRPEEWSAIAPKNRPLSPTLSIFGRLKGAVDLQQANAELAVLDRQYATAHPTMLDAKRDSPDLVVPLKEELISDVRPKLWLLFGAVGFVLLIVCANIGSLLLARATYRAREFAVRAAIGAGRGTIIRQLLVESLLLAFLGGALGIGLAATSLSGIRSLTFVDLPRTGEIRMDALVLGFGAALALITGVAFGLMPALAASRPDIAVALRGSGEGTVSMRSKAMMRLGSRGFLVVGQVALSIILLIGATLLIESLARVYRVDPGFQTGHLLTAKISLSPSRYGTDEKKAAFYRELIDRIQSLPGVRGAAVTLTLPMTDMWIGAPVQLAGTPPLELNERPISIVQDISPGYLHTMGIAVERGREFTTHDDKNSVPVALVSENLVRLFLPQYPSGPDPVGQRILFGSDPQPVEIVGVTANVRYSERDDDPKAEIYFPSNQKPMQSAMLAVRTTGDPLSFANLVRSQVLAIDRDQPISAVSTMDDLVEQSEGQLRLMMRLLGAFAGVATFLAVIGLYGVITYSVVQRTKEIGIRRALGAPRNNILALVARQTMSLTVAGVVLGIGGALALTRLMRDLLFQVSASDPLTFVGVAVLFVIVALTAGYIPARRASEIDPLAALRVG